MKRFYLTPVVASIWAVTAFAGTRVGIGISIGAPAPIIVRRAPPVRVVERVTVSPGPGYTWVAGHYTWAGDRWIWMSGTWVVPPQPGAQWIDGSWNPQTQQWIEAHWEMPPPPPPPASVAVTTPAMPPPPPAPPTTEVIVTEAPPQPVYERVVAAPGRGYIWIAGYWGWEHGRRVWISGHWERPPHGHHAWVPARWEPRGHGYVYISGYWR
jgi:hypothetical protein